MQAGAAPWSYAPSQRSQSLADEGTVPPPGFAAISGHVGGAHGGKGEHDGECIHAFGGASSWIHAAMIPMADIIEDNPMIATQPAPGLGGNLTDPASL